jgi:hypothetical protein
MRYDTATVITEVKTSRISNSIDVLNRYLDTNRKQYDISDFDYKVFFSYTAQQGVTLDQLATLFYGDGSLGWIILDFNDFISVDPFYEFQGYEELILPSVDVVFHEILKKVVV